MPKRIVLCGSIAQRPRQGGHTWVFLQYLLGFRRLGWDVLFLDWLDPAMCVDADGGACSVEDSQNLRYLQRVMEGFGLQDSWALFYDRGGRSAGLSRRTVLERTREAALLVNVMGFFEDDEILGCASARAFLDIDPGFPQMWQDLGLASLLRGYDHYVTIGENIGRPECAIPTCGLGWITTRQPIVLDDWKAEPLGDGAGFVGIGAWRGPFAPVEYRGQTYGLRVHEFRRFMGLPRHTGRPFTLALDIHPAEEADLASLHCGGWSLVDPRTVADDPWTYRAFVQSSLAEFMVAKNMYVRANSGWFSDRSICFLASGRPVLAQDTGLAGLYPLGEGLIAFNSIDEAIQGAEEIASDPHRHSLAARSIAHDYFDSGRVLPRLLEKLGVG